MNIKRWLIASIVVYIVMGLTEYIVHGIILMGTYEATASVWRPMEEIKGWIGFVTGAIFSLIFVYIFIKGYEGKGIMEGARYGLWIGLMFTIPNAYGFYSVLPIPYSLALMWWIFGTVQIVIYGIVAAAIYRPVSA